MISPISIRAPIWRPISLLLLTMAPTVAQADETVPAPTPLECAAYYYLTEVSFLLAPMAAAHGEEIVGPAFGWAQKLIQSSSKEDQKAAVAKVQRKMHELTAQPHPAGDVAAMLQPVASYYDPLCHTLAGQPPLDLGAMLARAKQLTAK